MNLCLFLTLLQSLGLLKAQSELTSQLEAANAKQEALIADLKDKNEKLAVTNQKLTSELAEVHLKLDEKAEQLKAIEQKMDELAKNLSTIGFDKWVC